MCISIITVPLMQVYQEEAYILKTKATQTDK